MASGTGLVDASAPKGEGSSLGELALLFLKLGATSFGGPAAHIAMMEDEVVRRRRWLSEQEFLDLLGATNLIPGPNSTEMAIHVGWHRGRWAGLLVAGTCFILPAVLVVTCLAWAYVRFGSRPAAEGLLYGIKPVIIAVVVQAIWRLAPSALKTRALVTVAAVTFALSLSGMDELILLALGGVVAVALHRASRGHAPGRGPALGMFALPLAVGPAAAAGAAGVPFGLPSLFLTFLKIGSVLYGSGYVLLAFLRSEFVGRLGWMSEGQLLDAVSVGQLTPGPVFTTATFIGYVLGGLPGASAATVGIFLPAFAFVAAIGPFVPRLRRSATLAAALDGLNAASLAIMAAVTVQLARAAIIDALTLWLAALGAVLLVRFKINSTWLILVGGLAGVVSTAAGLR